MTTTLQAENASLAETYFDLVAALDRCCGDTDFLAEMVDLLQSTVATQRCALRAAIHTHDPQAIARSAHSLKGAVASMTTAAPYAIAREIELLGMQGETAGVDVLLTALEVSLDQLLRETREWSANHVQTTSL